MRVVARLVVLFRGVRKGHRHLLAWVAGMYGYPVDPLVVVIHLKTGSVLVMWIGSVLMARCIIGPVGMAGARWLKRAVDVCGRKIRGGARPRATYLSVDRAAQSFSSERALGPKSVLRSSAVRGARMLASLGPRLWPGGRRGGSCTEGGEGL